MVELTDEDEYIAWTDRGDPVLHIELKELAAGLLVAPLSANTMAKFANGLCDNLLTSVFRAWPYEDCAGKFHIQKPVFVAPAMNTNMYQHPITKK